MKKYNFLFFTFLIVFFGCSSSDGQDTVVGIDPDPTPAPETPVAKDPDDADYWDAAELVWSDEFDGTKVSEDNWVFEDRASGWVNDELQNYQPEGNTEVADGILKIIAKKNVDNTIEGAFTSARINSVRSFKYGRMEIRAKMPDYKGNGLWPALWMLGNNIETVGWPACGEIDIMEYVSFKSDKTHSSLHSTANNHTNGTEITSGALDLETIEEEFHNFGLLWSSKYIKFYIDTIDNVVFIFRRPTTYNIDSWPFQNNFYFIMNVAVGGSWGGLEGVDSENFPATMEVDYVRVYQVK